MNEVNTMTQFSDPSGSEAMKEHTISEEEIDQTLEESFPASDPPQWTLGVESHSEPHEEGASDDEKDAE